MTMQLNHRLRQLFVNTPIARRVELKGRKIIVTGASPGSLGFETAAILASWGAKVIVSSRSDSQGLVEHLHERLPDRAKGSIDARDLDLAQAQSVAAFAQWYKDAHGEQLDVLINNAGIHLDLLSEWKAPQLSADGFEIHWRSNYLGTMHLTHLLLPLLIASGKATGDARVVNVSSQLHAKGTNPELFERVRPYNSWEAYGLSKLALVHAAFEIQRRFAHSANLQGYCLHPGSVFTNVASKGLAGHAVIAAMRHLLSPVEAFFLKTPWEGAQTQVYCATSPGLQGGRYFQDCEAHRASQDTIDSKTAARLWDETERWVNELA
jgi:NAD(P)-dependent dehydrogenase (short-subunit alcohol dehydrogenase family)